MRVRADYQCCSGATRITSSNVACALPLFPNIRLEKDWEFAKDHQLFYFVWSHQVSTTEVSTIAELKRCLARQTRGYAVCPFEFVYALCKQKPPTKINSKYGGSDSRATYGEGYRVNLGALKDFWKPY